MKKKITRIMACFMACFILANTVAIPRAKASAAVVGTSALATSALASYMTATGVSLSVISGGAAAASTGTAGIITGYAAATGATYEVVTSAIAAGATISGGAIILGAAAVAVLAGIVAWHLHNTGLTDEDGTPTGIQFSGKQPHPFEIPSDIALAFPYHLYGYRLNADEEVYWLWCSVEPLVWKTATGNYGTHTGLYANSTYQYFVYDVLDDKLRGPYESSAYAVISIGVFQSNILRG